MAVKLFQMRQGESENLTFSCQRREQVPYDLTTGNFQVHARLIGAGETVAGDFDTDGQLATNGLVILPELAASDKSLITIEVMGTFSKTLAVGAYTLVVAITETGASPEPLRYEIPKVPNFLTVSKGYTADLA